MKRTAIKTHLPIVLILILGLFGIHACDKPESLENDSETSETIKADTVLTDAELLERKMQWASYMSVRTFCENDVAKNEVASRLSIDQTVDMDDLLLDLDFAPAFRNRFIDLIWHYHFFIFQNGKPTHNVAIPPFDEPDPAIINAYIDFITIENCVELFFPNGLSPESMPVYNFFYSTAHPMAPGVNENYGFLRQCEFGISPGLSPSPVTEVTVSQSLVSNGYPIVVARPFKIKEDPICNYDKFSDFTLFLNQ